MEKTPLCCEVKPWRVRKCCRVSFRTVGKAAYCTSAAGWLWHTWERRGTCTRGSGISQLRATSGCCRGAGMSIREGGSKGCLGHRGSPSPSIGHLPANLRKAWGGLAQRQREHAKDRQAFPRCLAAKCLRLCLNARCGIFFPSDL